MKRTFFSRFGFAIILLTAACFAPMGMGALKAMKSNKNEVQDWLPAQYEETKSFNWFQDHFAGEQFVLLSWEGCTLDDQRLTLLMKKLVPADPAHPASNVQRCYATGLTGPTLIERLMADPINATREQALDRLSGSLVSENGDLTCAVITLSEYGKEHLRESIETIYKVAEDCNIHRDALHMGGPPVDNVAIDVAGEKSLYRLAFLALAVGLTVSWWCLRSGRLITMVFVTGVYSAALSLALVYFSGTNMNAILLTMPPLVYVAAVSGAIHLSNYYRDSIAEIGLERAPGAALKHAALPLGLATGTTAIGLLSLAYSELVPIQLFGIYSAVGVLASAAILCFFLPAAFETWPLDPKKLGAADDAIGGSGETSRWWAIADYITEHSGLVTVSSLIVMAFFTYGLTKIETSVQLMRMFPKDSWVLKDYQWLETNLGRLVPMEVVLKIDPEKSGLDFVGRMDLVKRVQQRIESLDDVGRSMSAVTFAPEIPPLEQPADGKPYSWRVATERRIRSERLERHRDEFLQGGYLAEEDGQDLWRISARVWALKDIDYGEFVQQVQQVVEQEIGDAPVQDQAGVHGIYTGLVPLVYKAQRSLLDGLLFGFIMDLVVVTIVMTIAVREWSAGLILALPSIFPVVIVFGAMGWLGIIVDTGTVMAPAVALGVTVDDVVHFMLMYRNGLKRGLDRRGSLRLAYKGCARAMYQSWGVIGIGLSAFAMSPFMPTKRFGYMMVTLLSAALVGNLVVLPAVLASPMGAVFGRRFQKRNDRKASQPSVSEPVLTPALHRMIRRDERASEATIL